MAAEREKLPAHAAMSEVLACVEANDVTVISGGTGCGKSTQVPQFLLDHMTSTNRGAEAFLICTQPRRIAAVGVAERVADERDEKVGGTVGYSIHLEAARSAETRVLFCTTGVLLRMLENDPGLVAPGQHLGPVSHVIIDEVHERSIDSDLLLLMARERLLRGGPPLKLILMSATLDAEIFTTYFGQSLSVGVVHIQGRTFPVQRFHLAEAVEQCGYRCELGSYYARQDINRSHLERETGSGALPGDEADGVLEELDVPESLEGLNPSERIIAENLRERQRKEANIRANNAKGVGTIGGLVQSWMDRVGQAGMSAYDTELRSVSRPTLDSLRCMDHMFTAVNSDLITCLVKHIVLSKATRQAREEGGGAVLVFCAGLQEIKDLMEAFGADSELGQTSLPVP